MGLSFRTRKRRRPNQLSNGTRHRRRPVMEELEPRIVLAPVIDPDLASIFSIRQVTDAVTGRIEVAPISFAGGDTFVIERTGPTIERPTAPLPGTINRVTTGGLVNFFASLPGDFIDDPGDPSDDDDPADLGFGGYVNFFDMVVDPIGIFDGIPSLFVSTSHQVDPTKNAIYRFNASGQLIGGGPFATFIGDADADLTFDDHPTILAISPPGSPFGPGLFVADVEEEGGSDGDDLFIFRPGYTSGQVINTIVTPLPIGVQRTSNLASGVTPAQADLDIRGMIFDPGTLYGSRLIAQSTDLEDGTAATTVGFNPPTAQTGVNFLGFSEPLTVHHFTDVAFDPAGFFSINASGTFEASLFSADNNGGLLGLNQGVIHRIAPTGGFNDADPFARGFNVGVTDLAVNPIGGMDRAFSISFSPDGFRLQAADLDGIWEIRSDFALPCSAAGLITGVCDVLVDLARPYRGAGTAVAVLDTGVDVTHPGFAGLVTQGVDVALGGATGFGGTLDEVGHGTAVAGIIHQIAPDTVIVPVKWDITGTGGFSNRQIIWEAIRFVADNPFVQHPFTGQMIPIIAGNMSLGLINSELVFDSEAEAAITDPTTLFPYKDQFQRWAALGIYPVAAAGNEGLFFGASMDAIDLPGVINEVVSVAASYPFGPTPPLPPPTGASVIPGDLLVLPDKVTAFSSRNQDTDFLAPGTALRTFNPVSIAGSPSGLPPLELNFTGTSGSTPFVVGIYAMVHSALNFWIATANAAFSTAGFLGGSSGSPIPLPGIRSLAGFLNPDGINAILQWTADPHEDRDLLIEDVVSQQGRLVEVDGDVVESGSQFRIYSRIDAAQAIAAIEGAIAFDFFVHNPSFIGAMDSNRDGIITDVEIQSFVDGPSGNATAKAMARLLGGTASDALRRRTQFFDRIDGPNGFGQPAGIRVSQFSTLSQILLPGPGTFRITERIENGNVGYLVDPNRDPSPERCTNPPCFDGNPATPRNWHDLTLMIRSANFVDGVPREFRGRSPADFGGSTALDLKRMLPRDPLPISQDDDGGGSGSPGGGGDPLPPHQSPAPSSSASYHGAIFRDGQWLFDSGANGGAAESVRNFGMAGDIPVLADWDGDGTNELAVFRRGIWYFDLGKDGGVAERSFAFGLPDDIPVVGDYNGDGRADPAVFRNGTWYIDLAFDGGAADVRITFGLALDRPLMGDFNGDGSTDLVLFRDGTWYIDLNRDGGAADVRFTFGLATDVPVLGDYNGDGRDDAIIFRAGTWYVDLDGSGGNADQRFAFGGVGDVPVWVQVPPSSSLTQTSPTGSMLSGGSWSSSSGSSSSSGGSTSGGGSGSSSGGSSSSSSGSTSYSSGSTTKSQPTSTSTTSLSSSTDSTDEQTVEDEALLALLDEWSPDNLLEL